MTGPFDGELVVSSGLGTWSVFPLDRVPTTIGSAEGCDVRVSESSLAPRHASIELREGGALWLRDLAGDGHTLVNGKAVSEAPIEEGAIVKLGATELLFRRRGPITTHR